MDQIKSLALEPKDYFNIFKSKIKNTSKDESERKIKQIEKLIKDADDIGQINLSSDLKMIWRACISELVLFDNGITKYVKRDAIEEYIDKVNPKNSVKIVELERYPRIIPEKNLKEIKRIKDLNIFDEICVLFTDFTDNEYKTKEEKELVKRNRDPVCFGFFMNHEDNEKYGNFYLITDWEDEYCDLTYDKIIDKLSDSDHGEIVEESIDDKWNRFYRFNIHEKTVNKTELSRQNQGFFERIKGLFK